MIFLPSPVSSAVVSVGLLLTRKLVAAFLVGLSIGAFLVSNSAYAGDKPAGKTSGQATPPSTTPVPARETPMGAGTDQIEGCRRGVELTVSGVNAASEVEQERLYSEAISGCSAIPEAHYNRAVLYRRQGKREVALTDLTKALELRDDDRFRVARGLVYDDLGQYDAARSDYRAVLGRNPRDAAALIGLAKILEKQGDRAQAIETLERGRDSDPNSALIRLNLGIIYELAGRMFDAGGEYARATELDALNGEAWYRSGLIQMHRGETKKAISLFEQAIAAGGVIEAPSRATLARLYRQSRLFDKAELVLRRGLERSPDDRNLQRELILVLSDDQQFEKVIELAGALLLREPGQASILLVKGSAERHLGRLEAAERSLRASAELEEANPLVHYELALLLRTLGKADDAAHHAELSKKLQAQEFNAGSSASEEKIRGANGK